MGFVEALGKIKQGHPANRIAWQNQSPDSGDTYPLSVKAVLLEPLQPVNLERDGLLPALIVQYGDGVREYKPIRNNPNNRFSSRSSQNYATLSEYEETMMVTIRAILRPTLEATLELATEGGLTGESLTIMTANLHESIDTALGDGLTLSFRGERIEGIKELKVMKWTTPFDMWASDYAILDIPVQITHTVTRGKGV